MEKHNLKQEGQCAIHDVSGSFDFRKEAQKQIYKCKESCYGKGTNASNVSEGDYGTWKDWEDVLVKFAKKAVAKNLR